MPRHRKLQEAYDACRAEGMLERCASDEVMASSLLRQSLVDERNGRRLAALREWSSAFKLLYDAIHELGEALCVRDGVRSRNHLCLFAYLCTEYGLEWSSCEEIRRKRNGINYYGERFDENSWRLLKPQTESVLASLRRAAHPARKGMI